MLDKRVKPVRDVTRGIRAVDKTCEALMTSAAQLTIDMVAVTEAFKMPVTVGQEAFELVGRLMTAGIEARALSATAHLSLRELAVTHEAPVDFGDGCPPDPNPPMVETEEQRRGAMVRLVA